MRRLILTTLFAVIAHAALAQQPPPPAPTTLLADQMTVAGSVLTATGNVTLWVNGQHMTAATIRFDQGQNRLDIEGPIRLTDADGTIILASQAELDRELQTAILRDARMILSDRLQMAAAEIRRPNARYTGLFKVAMTSCYVCAGGTPIWQIRARQIVHDAQDRQIYLDDVQLRLWDIPVLYLPRLRLPDPTLKRATGFLVPKLKSNSLTGFGLRLPYFIRINDHRDLTLSPELSQHATSLEFRYRQAFHNGDLEITGAGSQDNFHDGSLRGYLFSTAQFDLPRQYRLDLQLRGSSDPSYLREYGFSGLDRLQSFAQVSRTNERGYGFVQASHYKSLRASEDNSLLPSLIVQASNERRYFPQLIGGEARYQLGIQAARRASDLDIDGVDLARWSGRLEWQRNWVSDAGVVFDLGAQTRVDHYQIDQHSGFPAARTNTRSQLHAGIALPLQRHGMGGREVITPRLQFRLGHQDTDDVPNQDSTRVEFDTGNLFAFQQTPGADLLQSANSTALGLDWTRQLNTGAQGTLSLGRIWWRAPQSQFSLTSGLQGTQSDWVISGGWNSGSGLDVLARLLLDDATGDVQKAEAHVDILRPAYGIYATYTFLNEDPDEGRSIDVSELALNSSYRVDSHWTLQGNFRYDFGADEMTTAGFGVQFKNECIGMNLTASRRFESNPALRSSNDYEFTIDLLGFGADQSARPVKHSCGGRR